MKTTPNLKTLKPHPLGAIFPTMSDPDYEILVTGIQTNGYDKRHPIVLFDNAILDGNHRYTAAKKAKIPLTPDLFTEYNGDDPIGFVIKENLARRNLTPSQASMLAAELVEKMEEADKAAKAANSQTSNSEKPKAKKAKGAKVTAAAKKLNVSPRSVAAARALKKKNPKAAEAVKKGGKTLHAATTETEAKQSKEEALSAEFAKATERIDEICGPGFALIAAKKLLSKHILQLSHLEPDEMKRIKPFIEAGWPLKAALGHKSVTLVPAHSLRNAIDRAIEAGGKFMVEMPAYDKTWIIDISEKTVDPDRGA